MASFLVLRRWKELGKGYLEDKGGLLVVRDINARFGDWEVKGL